jgi:hypothetical protein
MLYFELRRLSEEVALLMLENHRTGYSATSGNGTSVPPSLKLQVEFTPVCYGSIK